MVSPLRKERTRFVPEDTPNVTDLSGLIEREHVGLHHGADPVRVVGRGGGVRAKQHGVSLGDFRNDRGNCGG